MNKMKNIRYSIIIPHKDSFELLLRLLNSISDRNDFEIIIVDDNSISNEKKMLRDYSFNENVTLIFNNKSEGAGKARNIALEKVRGDWVIFADADDFFLDNMDMLLDEHYNTPYDIIYFGSTSIFNDTGAKANRHERYMGLVSEYVKDNGKEDALKYFYTPPWSKMIRREILRENDIKFEEIITSNDIYFSLKSAFFAKSISATEEVLYSITMSYGSLTNTISLQHFEARFNAALRANKFLCSINKKKYQQSILYFLAKSYMFGGKYMIGVFVRLLKNRSNLFIGMSKIFNIKKVLNQRENNSYLKKQN